MKKKDTHNVAEDPGLAVPDVLIALRVATRLILELDVAKGETGEAHVGDSVEYGSSMDRVS